MKNERSMPSVEQIVAEVKDQDVPTTPEAESLSKELWDEKWQRAESVDQISIDHLILAMSRLTGRSCEQLRNNWIDLMRANRGDTFATLVDFLAAHAVDMHDDV